MIFSDLNEDCRPMHHNTNFEIAEPGTFVGLRSPPSYREVIMKDTAAENMQDKYDKYDKYH